MLRLIHFLYDRPTSPNVGYGILGAYAIVYLGIAVSYPQRPLDGGCIN
jgi:hypothetical protein